MKLSEQLVLKVGCHGGPAGHDCYLDAVLRLHGRSPGSRRCHRECISGTPQTQRLISIFNYICLFIYFHLYVLESPQMPGHRRGG